jgi:hypothetical protein
MLSANQEISRLVWIPKVNYFVHNCPSIDPVLGEMEIKGCKNIKRKQS